MARATFIAYPPSSQKYFPWKAVDVEAAFFKDFDARITIHNPPIGSDFEGIESSWLQGFHNVIRWLLAPILQRNAV
jgi:hypothetical protein